MSKHPYQILIKPLLTERATAGQDLKKKQYAFQVSPESNKVEIRQAIEAAFKVRVLAVNTIVNKGKRKRLRTAKFGRRPAVKKAIITLAEGDSINLI